jgi:gamma-glutamyl phosphate reductase
MNKDLESIQEARDLAEAAHAAFLKFEHFTEDQVEKILAEMSKAGIAQAAMLAKMAVEETGYGTVEHKTLKNLFCARDVYNAIKPMKTVGIVREDPEKRIFEVASPIGVIAAIIPSTNPTSTAIYKALIALKGRNAIVFSPHPSATKCILETSRLMAQAAENAGAPKGTISCMKASTIEGAEALMKHNHTALILATGGTGLVKAAYSAGKPAFGVGPGNVPTYIESTADVPKAVRDILTGKTFDNGTLCSSEQSIVCDESIKDAVLEELKKAACVPLQSRRKGIARENDPDPATHIEHKDCRTIRREDCCDGGLLGASRHARHRCACGRGWSGLSNLHGEAFSPACVLYREGLAGRLFEVHRDSFLWWAGTYIEPAYEGGPNRSRIRIEEARVSHLREHAGSPRRSGLHDESISFDDAGLRCSGQ